MLIGNDGSVECSSCGCVNTLNLVTVETAKYRTESGSDLLGDVKILYHCKKCDDMTVMEFVQVLNGGVSATEYTIISPNKAKTDYKSYLLSSAWREIRRS